MGSGQSSSPLADILPDDERITGDDGSVVLVPFDSRKSTAAARRAFATAQKTLAAVCESVSQSSSDDGAADPDAWMQIAHCLMRLGRDAAVLHGEAESASDASDGDDDDVNKKIVAQLAGTGSSSESSRQKKKRLAAKRSVVGTRVGIVDCARFAVIRSNEQDGNAWLMLGLVLQYVDRKLQFDTIIGNNNNNLNAGAPRAARGVFASDEPVGSAAASINGKKYGAYDCFAKAWRERGMHSALDLMVTHDVLRLLAAMRQPLSRGGGVEPYIHQYVELVAKVSESLSRRRCQPALWVAMFHTLRLTAAACGGGGGESANFATLRIPYSFTTKKDRDEVADSLKCLCNALECDPRDCMVWYTLLTIVWPSLERDPFAPPVADRRQMPTVVIGNETVRTDVGIVRALQRSGAVESRSPILELFTFSVSRGVVSEQKKTEVVTIMLGGLGALMESEAMLQPDALRSTLLYFDELMEMVYDGAAGGGALEPWDAERFVHVTLARVVSVIDVPLLAAVVGDEPFDRRDDEVGILVTILSRYPKRPLLWRYLACVMARMDDSEYQDYFEKTARRVVTDQDMERRRLRMQRLAQQRLETRTREQQLTKQSRQEGNQDDVQSSDAWTTGVASDDASSMSASVMRGSLRVRTKLVAHLRATGSQKREEGTGQKTVDPDATLSESAWKQNVPAPLMFTPCAVDISGRQLTSLDCMLLACTLDEDDAGTWFALAQLLRRYDVAPASRAWRCLSRQVMTAQFGLLDECLCLQRAYSSLRIAQGTEVSNNSTGNGQREAVTAAEVRVPTASGKRLAYPPEDRPEQQDDAVSHGSVSTVRGGLLPLPPSTPQGPPAAEVVHGNKQLPGLNINTVHTTKHAPPAVEAVFTVIQLFCTTKLAEYARQTRCLLRDKEVAASCLKAEHDDVFSTGASIKRWQQETSRRSDASVSDPIMFERLRHLDEAKAHFFDEHSERQLFVEAAMLTDVMVSQSPQDAGCAVSRSLPDLLLVPHLWLSALEAPDSSSPPEGFRELQSYVGECSRTLVSFMTKPRQLTTTAAQVDDDYHDICLEHHVRRFFGAVNALTARSADPSWVSVVERPLFLASLQKYSQDVTKGMFAFSGPRVARAAQTFYQVAALGQTIASMDVFFSNEAAETWSGFALVARAVRFSAGRSWVGVDDVDIRRGLPSLSDKGEGPRVALMVPTWVQTYISTFANTWKRSLAWVWGAGGSSRGVATPSAAKRSGPSELLGQLVVVKAFLLHVCGAVSNGTPLVNTGDVSRCCGGGSGQHMTLTVYSALADPSMRTMMWNDFTRNEAKQQETTTTNTSNTPAAASQQQLKDLVVSIDANSWRYHSLGEEDKAPPLAEALEESEQVVVLPPLLGCVLPELLLVARFTSRVMRGSYEAAVQSVLLLPDGAPATTTGDYSTALPRWARFLKSILREAAAIAVYRLTADSDSLYAALLLPQVDDDNRVVSAFDDNSCCSSLLSLETLTVLTWHVNLREDIADENKIPQPTGSGALALSRRWAQQRALMEWVFQGSDGSERRGSSPGISAMAEAVSMSSRALRSFLLSQAWDDPGLRLTASLRTADSVVSVEGRSATLMLWFSVMRTIYRAVLILFQHRQRQMTDASGGRSGEELQQLQDVKTSIVQELGNHVAVLSPSSEAGDTNSLFVHSTLCADVCCVMVLLLQDTQQHTLRGVAVHLQEVEPAGSSRRGSWILNKSDLFRKARTLLAPSSRVPDYQQRRNPQEAPPKSLLFLFCGLRLHQSVRVQQVQQWTTLTAEDTADDTAPMMRLVTASATAEVGVAAECDALSLVRELETSFPNTLAATRSEAAGEIVPSIFAVERWRTNSLYAVTNAEPRHLEDTWQNVRSEALTVFSTRSDDVLIHMFTYKASTTDEDVRRARREMLLAISRLQV